MKSPPSLPAIFLLLFGACGEEDRTPIDFTPSVDRNATAADDTVPRLPPVSTPIRVQPRDSSFAGAAVHLESIGGSTLIGEVLLEPVGSAGAITTRLTGGAPGLTYQGEIRRGTCDAIGGRMEGLVPVTANATGLGRSYSSVTANFREMTARPHIVTFGHDGEVEACGAVGSSPAAAVSARAQ